MGGGCQESAAYHSGPEAVAVRGTEAEIEDTKLASAACDVIYDAPASRYQMQDGEESDDGAGDVDGHLHYVGPNYRRHASLERVDQRQQRNNCDGNNIPNFRRDPEMGKDTAECDADNDRNCPDADAFRRCARRQEESGSKAMQASSKTRVDELISSVELSPKVLGYEDNANHHPRDKIAEHNLQEAKVAVVCQARNADHSQRTGFSRNYRQRDRPPGDIAVRQKVAFERTVGRTKANSK